MSDGLEPTISEPVHWIGDAPTSLHGNGASSFELTTRDTAEVTCKLCLTLLAGESTPKRGQWCNDRHDEHPNFTYAATHWHPEPTDSTNEGASS